MSEDKEALKKEFEEDYCHYHDNGDLIVCSRPEHVFNFWYTKLKNQAEEYVTIIKGKDNLLVDAHKRIKQLKAELDSAKKYIAATETEYAKCQYKLIDLKAELSRKDEILKAAEQLIGLSDPPNNPDAKKIWENYRETYKTLTK